jgi:hypothetical protein
MANIRIDTRELFYTRFLIPERFSEFMDGASVPTVDLEPGVYSFLSAATAVSFRFTITAAGGVDFDEALDGMLAGRGTSTLFVRGREIILDGTALSHDLMILGTDRSLPRTQAHRITLLPGQYGLLVASGVLSDLRFNVATDGDVSVEESFTGCTQINARRLTLLGWRIAIDGRALSHNLLPLLLGWSAGELLRDRVNHLTLLPASGYAFQSASGLVADFRFAIAADGQIRVDPIFAGFAQVTGSTLLLDGYRVTLDARSLSHSLLPLLLGWSSTELPPSTTHQLTFLPAQAYGFISASGVATNFSFGVSVAGAVTVDPRYAGFVRTEGLALTIAGYPVFFDARELARDILPFLLGWTAGPFPSADVKHLTIIPGAGYTFIILDTPQRFFSLTVDLDGKTTINPNDIAGLSVTGGGSTTTAPLAQLQGEPAAIELPAALANLNNRVTYDSKTGWPPRHASTGAVIAITPPPVAFTFAEWRASHAVAVANAQVQQLAGSDADWIGCQRTLRRSSRSQSLVSLRNRTTGKLVEVTVNGGDVVGVTVREPWEHPASPAEIARAEALVRQDPAHAPHVAGFAAHGIVRVPTDTAVASFRHRCIHLMFTQADDPHVERDVCYSALVDLELGRIVAAGRPPCRLHP